MRTAVYHGFASAATGGALAALLLLCAACASPSEEPRTEDTSQASTARPEVAYFNEALRQIEAYADSMDARLHPVTLLRTSEETDLLRFSNEEQLVVARRLGVRPPTNPASMMRLQASGRLDSIEASTAQWVVRDLEHSVALLTPDAKALLREIATRFQARIGALGLPALRLEVTSALRTAESQTDLRRSNRNATSGASTHEFGTTLDIAYSSFRAPLQPLAAPPPEVTPFLDVVLQRYETARIETVAARRSRELGALLGRVLREMQREGKVMVTLERQQPVYHMTVARRW